MIATWWMWASLALGGQLDELQTEAVRAHPGLEAMRAQVLALETRAASGGVWPDPVVSIEVSNMPLQTLSLGHSLAGVEIRAQQELRPPGWSERRRDAIARSGDVAEHELADMALQLRANVRVAWWSLARARQLTTLLDHHLELTTDLLESARAHVEAGSAGQSASLRVELYRERLRDERGDLRRDEREWRALLVQALGMSSDIEIVTPTSVDMAVPPGKVEWTTLAARKRPAVAAAEARIVVEESRALVAHSDRVLDPTVWAGYRLRQPSDIDPQGSDMVSAGVALPIPTGSARAAGSQQDAAMADADRRRSERDQLLQAIRAEGQGLLAGWQRAATKQYAYTHSLVPAARTALQASRDDVAAGRAELATVLEGAEVLLELERALVEATIDTQLAAARAEALVGVPVGRAGQ